MNILISVNENYLDKAETMLFSLRQHTEEPVDVYLLNHSLTHEKVKQTSNYLNVKCNITVHEIDVRHTALDDFPIGNSHFSVEMYYRILAQFLLPITLERILWLDSDIIIRKNLGDFYHQSFDGKYYVVCPDKNDKNAFVMSIKKKLEMDLNSIYFNSGVILMNLSLLRNTCSEDIMDTCEQLKDKLTYPDQDILNYLYEKKVKYSPWRVYNYQVGNEKKIPGEYIDDIVILHYTEESKPWDYWKITNASRFYWKVYFARGKRVQTIKAYLLRCWESVVICYRDIRSIF